MASRSETYLDDLVPTGGDNDGVLGVGAEANAADPLGVTVVGDVELALAEGVPELDGAVARARDDLAVVGGEGDREDVGGVANEAAGGGAGVEVPETQGLVPRGGEGELAVGRDDNVRDEVVVAVEDALGVAVVGVVARQLPDDDGAVTRGGEEEVGVLLRGGDGGDPALVAGEGALVDERLRPANAKSPVGRGQFAVPMSAFVVHISQMTRAS